MLSRAAILIGFFSKLAVTLSFSFLPGAREDLFCGALCLGRLQACKAAFSLGSVLLVGVMGDRVGKRRVLAGGLGASLVAYLGCIAIAATHKHVSSLYLHLVPYSILYQNMSLLKAMFADSFLLEEARHRSRLKLRRGGAQQVKQTVRENMSVKKDDHSAHDGKRRPRERESTDTCGTSSGVSTVEVTAETSVMGYLGMSAAVSYMLGPLLGSVLFSSFESALWGSVVLVLASLVLVFSTLPTDGKEDGHVIEDFLLADKTASSAVRHPPVIPHENQSPPKKHPSGGERQGAGALAERVALAVLQWWSDLAQLSSGALLLLLVRLLLGFAYSAFLTLWPAHLKTRFAFTPHDYSLYFAFIGALSSFSQGFLAKRLVAIAARGDGQRMTWLLLVCVLLIALGRLLAFHVETVFAMYSCVFTVVLSVGVLQTVLNSHSIHVLSREEKDGAEAPAPATTTTTTTGSGGFFSLMEAAEHLSALLGPLVGGILATLGGSTSSSSDEGSARGNSSIPAFTEVAQAGAGGNFSVSLSVWWMTGLYVAVFVVILWGYNAHVMVHVTPAAADADRSKQREKLD